MSEITKTRRVSEALIKARQELVLSGYATDEGQYDQAVVHAKAAVVILRGFEPPLDERKDYLVLFAEASHTLVRRLIRAGRVGEMVEPIRETVQIYQQLATVSGVSVIQTASLLLTLSSDASSVLLHAEAVQPAQEAAEILRRFQPAPDEQALYDRVFAEALYTLAFRLQTVGRNGKARPPAEAAIKVLRRLAAADPEQFGPFLQKAEALHAKVSEYFCGVSYDSGSIDSRVAISFGNGRWNRGALRVSIDTTGCNLVNVSGESLTPFEVITNAFGLWKDASTFFTFTQVPATEAADIRVVFGGSDIDPKLGTPGTVLAIGGYPESSEQGSLKFDSAEIWSADGSVPETKSLLAVALHEIGHVLGISHSNQPGALMEPFYNEDAVEVDAEARAMLHLIYEWTPQQQLPDRGTSDRVALGVASSGTFTSLTIVPRMIWKGVSGDTTIYESELRSAGWTPQRNIPDIGSSHSPVLAQINVPGPTPRTGLIMAWKGIPDDQGLYWSRDQGDGWEPQKNIEDVGSSTRPALANVAGRIFMAWKGIEDDSNIYWSQFNGVDDWSPQRPIKEFGTSDSPALIGVGNLLFMFWKGVSGDSTAWWSVLDTEAEDPQWSPQKRIEYKTKEMSVPKAIGTTGGLTATLLGNGILIAWKGVVDDSGIYVSMFTNDEFGRQLRVQNVGTSVGPSIVQQERALLMAWKGVEGDSTIWWSQVLK